MALWGAHPRFPGRRDHPMVVLPEQAGWVLRPCSFGGLVVLGWFWGSGRVPSGDSAVARSGALTPLGGRPGRAPSEARFQDFRPPPPPISPIPSVAPCMIWRMFGPGRMGPLRGHVRCFRPLPEKTTIMFVVPNVNWRNARRASPKGEWFPIWPRWLPIWPRRFRNRVGSGNTSAGRFRSGC